MKNDWKINRDKIKDLIEFYHEITKRLFLIEKKW